MSEASPSASVREVEVPFFLQMTEGLGRLQRAARQRSWIETPRKARLTVLFFFAPWCADSRAAASLARRLQASGPGRGAAVLGVSEYGAPEDTEAFREAEGLTFPFVFESMSRESRERPDLWHRRVMEAIGDRRPWGTPLFLFYAAGSGSVHACAGVPEDPELERLLAG